MNKYSFPILLIIMAAVSLPYANPGSTDSLWADVPANQEIDSLKALVDDIDDDSTLAELYRDVSKILRKPAPTKAIDFARAANSIYTSINHRVGMAKSRNDIGYLIWRTGNFNEAIDNYNQALEIFKEVGDITSVARLSNNLGASYWGLGEYITALELYRESLNIRIEEGNLRGQSLILNNIGMIYQEWGLFDKAMSHHSQALELAEQIEDLFARAYSYMNIGACYKHDKKYTTALHFYNKAYEDYLAVEDIGASGIVLIDLGKLSYETGELAKAIDYYQTAIEKTGGVNSEYWMANARYHLAQAHAERKNYSEALPILSLSINKARSAGYDELIRDNLFLLAQIEEANGRIDKSYDYFKTATAVNDSIYNTENMQKLTNLQVKLAIDQESRKNELLEKNNLIQKLEIDRKNFLINAVFVVIAIILLAVAALYNRSLKLKKLNRSLNREITTRRQAENDLRNSEQAYRLLAQDLSESNELKNLLLDIITHDLINPAGNIHNVSEILLESNPNEEITKIIHNSAASLLDVLHNASTLSRVISDSKIPMQGMVLNDTIDKVLMGFKHQLHHAGMEVRFNPEHTIEVTANPLIEEVFRNYISNAIRHASAGRKIDIDISANESCVTVEVRDCGTTIPESDRTKVFRRSFQLDAKFSRGRGLGLAIVEKIASVHGGKVWVEPNTPCGNKFCFMLPLEGSSQ